MCVYVHLLLLLFFCFLRQAQAGLELTPYCWYYKYVLVLFLILLLFPLHEFTFLILSLHFLYTAFHSICPSGSFQSHFNFSRVCGFLPFLSEIQLSPHLLLLSHNLFSELLHFCLIISLHQDDCLIIF
jgi:hypothetical protein